MEVMQYRIQSDACIQPFSRPDAPGAFFWATHYAWHIHESQKSE